MGFFTDTSVCIGCKACEVACKEWNLVPEDGLNLLGTSYDNSGELSANTWRHVAFVEQVRPRQEPVELGMPATGPPGEHPDADRGLAAVLRRRCGAADGVLHRHQRLHRVQGV